MPSFKASIQATNQVLGYTDFCEINMNFLWINNEFTMVKWLKPFFRSTSLYTK
ncbi:hypothetical protein HMPREF0519_0862 [Lentilactobacillus hilgardii DSM 20176 = ATCC 8290]|uniref:Uncharacterized protein n=1 Tax=Lentilactobacillus hilgardii (strain ATCC 8290 / DSM 20176 / CCUG 30140 / JCM 1155 / KCTC 3500 / NBRC 15886 / NCIMB 8040 / NRRL B-1843 / 9) TaxID=1423757 RepID=C0XI01_LENH9|nr:hypothetical protein HMPREF0519_0862 [Lentilactobacillus hilgardii DSM 20176 = ATCC 8290]